MARSSLQTLLRLRKMAVDEAHAKFAGALDLALAAAAQARAAEGRIADEMTAASAIDASDAAVEAFGRWLPRGREVVAKARAQHDRTEAELTTVRASVDAARADLKLVEKLIEDQVVARVLADERRVQTELDERGPRHSAPCPD